MKTLWQDIRFGFRVLAASPGYTAVAVLTLAIGIAVNTTVFSWINSVLFNPFPGAGDPDGIALVESVTSAGENLVNFSYIDYKDYRDNLKTVEGLAIARHTPLSIGRDGRTERAWAELVSANYFDVLRVKPALGRTFLPEEGADHPGAFPVAVISDRLWRGRFQGDPNILGKTVRLNRRDLTIVGVMPPEFRGSIVGVAYDVWMPVTMAAAMGTGNGTLTFRGTRDIPSTIARLKPGVTVEQVRAEVSALAKRLEAAYPNTNRGVGAIAVNVRDGHLGAQALLARPLRILMAVCLLLLLIVCANVANLLLARAVARQREFSVRLALGAGRGRLARQLFTEMLLLAAAGGALGVLGAAWMGQSLAALLPPMDIPLAVNGGLNPATLGFTAAIVLVSALIAGTAPALLPARTGLNEALKEGGRSGGSGTHSHRLRGLLVVAQVTLATVALAGAGLFFRSFRNAGSIEPGFETKGISVSQFYLSYAGYSALEQRQFCRTVRERLQAQPGVVGVTYTDTVPLGSVIPSSPWHQMEPEGYTPGPNEQLMIHRALVPPGYLDFLGIPLLEGRDFTELDDEDATRVMIVNRTFARRYFGGGNPIGRKVRVDGQPLLVVGIAKDSKYHTPTEAPTPFAYIPFRQRFAPGLNFAVLVKTTGDPMLLTPIVRREALALNQDAVFSTTLLEGAVTSSLYPQKVAATLLGVVGIVCLLLTAAGVYGVMSYSVSQRTRELGLRMALGARPGHVLGLVAREGLLLTIPGLALGIAVALAASRLVRGMLVGVDAADPATFAAVALFLGAVTLLASYLPARRATRVDPLTALRCE